MTPAPQSQGTSSGENEQCACDSCPHCTDPQNNRCPKETGELKECDQFRCHICNRHFYELEQVRSRPIAQATTDDTLSALISENARIGAELSRAQKELARLNGQHDATIRREAYEHGKRAALLEKDNLQVSTVVGYEAGYKQGAREERERVLSLLEEWDYHNNRNFGKPHPVFADMIRLVREKPDEVKQHIESPRSSKEK